MAKRASRQKKVPKQDLSPYRPRVPREAPNKIDIANSHFEWRVGSVDFDGAWGWATVGIRDFFRDILPKLHDFESMTWAQIEGPKKSHFIRTDKLCKAARDRLVELELDDVGELFSLRITGRKRIWGMRTGKRLNLLWWDPEHQVCPSPKKRT